MYSLTFFGKNILGFPVYVEYEAMLSTLVTTIIWRITQSKASEHQPNERYAKQTSISLCFLDFSTDVSPVRVMW